MHEHTGPAVAHRWWRRGAMALFIVGMVALAVLNLPRSFDADLSKIGAGKPALVFVYPWAMNPGRHGADLRRAARLRGRS